MRITAVMSHSVSYVININFYGVARFAHCLALPVPPPCQKSGNRKLVVLSNGRFSIGLAITGRSRVSAIERDKRHTPTAIYSISI